MPSLSQFTLYSSSDRFGPGPLGGQAGSLLTVLDACLVNGYGSGQYTKPAAGWLKPLANSGSCYACYQQPSGSGFTMFLNDSGSSGTTQEAEITGWQYLTSMCPAGSTPTTNVGAGYGQFPLPQQSLTYGRVNLRKSATTGTGTLRNWLVAADAYTVYIWLQNGDNSGAYAHGGFGDFFSLYGASRDAFRCFIFGRNGENNATYLNADWTDTMAISYDLNYYANSLAGLSFAMPGHFIAASPSGYGSPIQFSKKGGPIGQNAVENGGQSYYNPLGGGFATPNGTDGNLYLVPLWVVNAGTAELRGQYRGIWVLCHPTTNFNDGQVINGSGALAGKTFLIVKRGNSIGSAGSAVGGMWALEITNTVQTN